MNEPLIALNEPISVYRGGLGWSPDELSRLMSPSPHFLEMLPIAVYACDAEGRILWFNGKAVELWGRAPRTGDRTELFCGSHKLYFDGRHIGREETPMAYVLKTGNPVKEAVGLVERPDGSQVWAMVHIDPVKDADGNLVGAINCFHDISEQKRTELQLKESERRSRELLEALPAAIYTTDADGRITFYNEAAVELSGRKPTLGADEWCVTWKLYNTDGAPLPHDQCPMAQALKENRPIRGAEAVAERPDGTRVPFIPYPTPLRDASGKLVGAVNMLVDISQRKQAESRQKTLLAELNHRVKNTLATVQSLAAQTMRGAGVDRQAREAFERRLFALSSAHDQLTEGAWESAELSAVLRALLAPFASDGEERITLDGPAVQLPPKAVLTLAMVVHELATNAAKYGALSVPSGAVAIAWRIEANGTGPRLAIAWREKGGPEVNAPQSRGFGSKLLERGIERELKGKAEVVYDRSGLRAAIDIPLRSET
jgi:PAS domain S-box-containing protein